MARIVVGLGGNLGDREENLRTALRKLQWVVNIEQVSSLYETEPVGFADQPWFLNAVCVGQTSISAEELLTKFKSIERTIGRTDGVRFGPRPIDIDILFFDNIVMDTPTLQIPHLRIAHRAFVLQPLAELLPKMIDPRSGKTIAQLLSGLKIHEQVKLAKRHWADDILDTEQTRQ